MKSILDAMAYVGGVLFSLMLLSGIIILVIITLQSMWDERYEDEDAEMHYDWRDLE